jgi:hypothetical protein
MITAHMLASHNSSRRCVCLVPCALSHDLSQGSYSSAEDVEVECFQPFLGIKLFRMRITGVSAPQSRCRC